MRTIIMFALAASVAILSGCAKEPEGNIVPEGVKIAKPGDPGPQPEGAVATPKIDQGAGKASSE